MLNPPRVNVNVYTHKDDLDGVVSAMLIRYWLNRSRLDFSARIRPIGYDEVDSIEPPAIVCDINLTNRPDHPVWQSDDSYIFDHHMALDEAPPHAAGLVLHLRRDACAAKIVWQATGAPPLFQDLVAATDAGDRFVESDTENFNIGRALGELCFVLGFWDMLKLVELHPLHNLLYPPVSTIANALKSKRDLRSKSLASKTAVDCGEYVVAIIPSGSSSEVGRGLSKRFDKPVLILNIERLAEGGAAPVEVRDTRGRARALARSFGGGGHPDAAGFEVAGDALRESMSKAAAKHIQSHNSESADKASITNLMLWLEDAARAAFHNDETWPFEASTDYVWAPNPVHMETYQEWLRALKRVLPDGFTR